MKKLLLFFAFGIFSISNISAQISNNLSIELSLASYTKPSILHAAYFNNYELNYLNGFNIGYTKSKNWTFVFGVQKIHSDINNKFINATETSTIQGAELNLGIRYTRKPDQRFHLSVGLALSEEVTRHQGLHSVDFPSTSLEINHRKHFIGLAPNLMLNFRLFDKIHLFADTRIKFGRIYFKAIENTREPIELYSNIDYRTTKFEPLNSFGLRFKL